MSREFSPCFRRYWVKTLEDGTEISQFDANGNCVLWDSTVAARCVAFKPFTKELVEKMDKVGEKGEVTTLPELTFKVDQTVNYHRHCVIHSIPHTKCHFCGTELAEGVEMVCPVCLGRNWYYCSDCDQLKAKPKIVKKQALCPDCVEPVGLLWVGCIIVEWEEILSHTHILEIDGHRHIILDLVVKG